MKEAAEEAAQTVLDSVAADAAAFPWFAAIMLYVILIPILWSVVEVMKDTALGGLKQKPKKGSGEKTVLGKITKRYRWYPAAVWGLTLGGGGGLGALAGSFVEALTWWLGMFIGMVAGATNGVGMKFLRGFGDRCSNFLFGWIKRRLGGGKGDEEG